MSYIMAGMDQKDFFVAPQLQFVKVVYTPVVAQSLSHGPDFSDLGFPSC